eukprot:6211799-Pleurochrysis_carterae.AAC.2
MPSAAVRMKQLNSHEDATSTACQRTWPIVVGRFLVYLPRNGAFCSCDHAKQILTRSDAPQFYTAISRATIIRLFACGLAVALWTLYYEFAATILLSSWSFDYRGLCFLQHHAFTSASDPSLPIR